MTSINRLAVCISAHAWNGDRTKVALCPNNNEVKIYVRKGTEFELETTLQEHDSVVTGIDWGRKENRIVTCSQDRNAYVWSYENNVWKPTLVILRINRAATAVEWSPKEDKFAVASGAKCFCVCYFEKDNNWWVSKHFKENVESTITSIAWHPNNILLAAGGTDNVVRVVSGFVNGIDQRKDVGQTAFGSKLPFGSLLASFNTNAWVKAVRWSPSGNRLAWVSHDSIIHFLECSTTDHKHTTVVSPYLPFQDLDWVDDNRVIAVGHDANLTLFTYSAAGWKLEKQLDGKKGGTKAAGGDGAKKFFQDKATLGAEDGGADRDLDTVHQNCVSVIRRVDEKTFSTSGLDGNLVIWPFSTLGL